MRFKSILPLFLLSYVFGGLIYMVESSYVVFYLMGLFAFINIMAILLPVHFSYGVMNPLKLSIISAGLLSLFTNDFSLLSVYVLLIFMLFFLENENTYKQKYKSKNSIQWFILNVKRIIVALILPFSITYMVLLLSPSEEAKMMFFVILYFSALFVLMKMFDGLVSYLFLGIVQVFLLFKVFNIYFSWGHIEMSVFAVTVLLFLLIGYGRKGLLNYVNNY